MRLLLGTRRTIGQRVGGFAVSIPLHVALLIAARASLSSLELPRPPNTIAVPEIRPVALTSTPQSSLSRDPMILNESERSDAIEDGTAHVSLPSFDFDITKIRARRNVLFPFLTADLRFLDHIAREVTLARKRLAGPFQTSAQARSVKPPLRMSDLVVAGIVDRAWSRKERWRRFSELARFVQSYDADQGRAPELLQTYLNRNILQPFCDYRIVTGPPRRETIISDHMLWAMLENASDHADFIDFVHGFATESPSSHSTTELLFILDKLVQGNRDALLRLISVSPEAELQHTSSVNRAAYDLVVALRRQYAQWLNERGLDSAAAIKTRYDDVRLRLLELITRSTPEGYRSGDARFLAGEILFNQGRIADAANEWSKISPDPTDSYVSVYAPLSRVLRASPVPDDKAIRRVLDGAQSSWRLFWYERLRQFGYSCDTF
jgi:hypothetical protein